jgi:hypothetical protein
MGDVANKRYELMNMPSDTLVIHCVDHRFQGAFRKFIVGELGIEVFNPMVIAGGAFAIGSEHYSRYGYIWDQIDYFIKVGGVKKLVLINHEDCKWYGNEFPDLEKSKLKEKGKIDLTRAAKNVGEKYPGVEVISFWAELSADKINFKKII